MLGSVVEEDDGPGLDLACHPLGDIGGGEVLPVQRVYIPLNRLHIHGPDGGDDVVVILPIGGPDEGGANTGDRLDLVVAGVDVGNDLVPAELGHVGVGVGVVHDLVACVVEGLYRLGVFVHPLPHHEEGGLDVILGQDVDELLGVLVAPG